MSGDVAAHDQKVTHSYIVRYPEHGPREGDVHYRDFHHYRNAHIATAKCAKGLIHNDFSECWPGPDQWPHGLELHHSHIEDALRNGVDLKWLEDLYPGVSNADEIGAWIESADNLIFLCTFHHRGTGGVHSATASDYESQSFIRNLIIRAADAK